MESASVSLGSTRITAIKAGEYYPDGGCLFGVIPKDRWSKVLPSNEANRVALNLNCYLIETGTHIVLLDTGGGSKLNFKASLTGGLHAPVSVPDLLRQLGIDPLRVDVVINTHLHWDHCGGNGTVCQGAFEPNFPNATYYCSEGEWQHAQEMNPRDAISYDPAQFDPLIQTGQMQLVAGDFEPVPHIKMWTAPGHTRDMQVVTAESNSRTFCFFSDLIPTTRHLQPGWIPAFDLYPLDSLSSKAKWLTQAAQDAWICGFPHDPVTAFGVVDGQFILTQTIDFSGHTARG
jgi:glyoxylase-like metal-dependent hydrolase (beta-lactamase superfamily II)